jgi:hypothetical protein
MRFFRHVLLAAVGVLSSVGLAASILFAGLLFHPSAEMPSSIPVACAIKLSPQPQTPEELYLDLLKKTLTRAQVAGRYERHSMNPANRAIRLAYGFSRRLLQAKGFELVRLIPADSWAYVEGGYENLRRMGDGETMVGLKQLDNVQFCVTDVLRRRIPGDVIEGGTWRGGVTILMRAVLKAYADKERKVWVADSFQGLPAFDRATNPGWERGQMAVSSDEVKQNFAGYGLLDDQVRFLEGFFCESLPGAPITRLAVLRLDADLYESTMDALNNLYPKLSVGGYAIFDDYQHIPGCRKAIDEYRASHGITEPIRIIDSEAVYWQREK